MHIEFLVEEESVEVALQALVPNTLGADVPFNVLVHQGKPDLLNKLPGRLKGYAAWLPADWVIVVLVDEDRQDCLELKAHMERAALDAGLLTKTVAPAGERFHVVNRIAIEELEAWFFGDVGALRTAYPRLPTTLNHRRPYRDPDQIGGGTCEALERILQRAGYYPSGLPKIEVARAIAPHMVRTANTSRSFQHFFWALDGLSAQLKPVSTRPSPSASRKHRR